MKSNKVFEFMKNNSRLLKKIGITFVIPLFLSTSGALIFLSAGWNLIAQSYMMGSTIFAQPNDDIGSSFLKAVSLCPEITTFPPSPGKVLPA